MVKHCIGQTGYHILHPIKWNSASHKTHFYKWHCHRLNYFAA